MTKQRLFTGFILAALALIAGGARADDANLELKVRQLESRIKRLEQAVTELRKESRGPKATTDSSDETTEEDDSVVYKSALDLLKALPDDAQPKHPKGWDKFSVHAAAVWLKEHPVGDKIEFRLKVNSATVRRNSTTLYPSALPWRVDITPKYRHLKYRGEAIQVNVRGRLLLTVQGDDAFAKKAERIKKGDTLRVSGRIKSASIGAKLSGQRKLEIHLNDYTVETRALK